MDKKAVFFDRDNTIIKNIPYLGDPTKVELLPYAKQALNLLKRHGYELFIISNQSGVGRGLITKDQVHAVNKEMERQLGDSFFSGIYCCYDTPENPVENFRKPSPLILQQASEEHGLDLQKSFFVGDKYIDVLTGKNAGCQSVLVLIGYEEEGQAEATKSADFVAKNLLEAAKWICTQSTEGCVYQ